MLYVRDKGMEGYYFIYLITESVNTENEYFERILHKIFDTEFLTRIQKFKKKTYQTLKDRAARVSEIGTTVKFDKESKLNFREEFIDIIKTIDLGDQKIILMIDEFSQTLENIIEDEGERSAVRFLQANRELRQDPVINQKIQFVFSGSIGLENIVSRLNSSHLVNDLDSLNVPPLSPDESHRLMGELTENTPISLSKANRNYILDRIQWYIPFYIQLAVQEISNLYPGNEAKEETGLKRITKKIIDRAFSRMLELRNCFEHWHMRLRKAFKKEEYSFAKALLNHISREENISAGEMLDLSKKFNITDEHKEIVNALVYDGYINNNADHRIYRFNSPLLKIWWWKNVAY